MKYLSVENLTLSFGGLQALKGVSFSIRKGEIYSLIGPNGAGKTSIFNCISGIHPPDSGRIFFQGIEITHLKPHQVIKRGIARTFQNIELFGHMTTLDNLMLGRHIHMKTGLFKGGIFYGGAAREEITHRRKVEDIIDFLELQAERERFVAGLPYGTQKLIELGRALAAEPQLLMLDEPSAGMNLEEREDLKLRLKDIRGKMGITILLVEHDMGMVMDISDRVCAINYGEKLIEASPGEVQSHPEVLKAYLGEEEIA